MSELPHELRALAEDLAKQQGLPPNAAAEIEQAILSSPHLSTQMTEAVRDGDLQRLRLSPRGANEGGHYDANDKAIYISTDTFTRYGNNQEQLRDILTSTLGHEVEHAFQAQEARKASAELAYRIEEKIREAGPGGQADLTGAFNSYLHTMRWHEADAEVAGWDALASQANHEGQGVLDRQRFLRSAAHTTSCVELQNNTYKPAPGIALDDDLSMSELRLPKVGPINREPVAQCHFDQPADKARLGMQGKSDYTNYYGTLGFSIAADVVSKWQNPPEILLDMDKLKFKKELLESNGLDLGGEGRTLGFTDPKSGFTSLSHTKTPGQKHGVPDLEADARGLAPSQPSHPDHSLYLQVQAGVRSLDTEHARPWDETSDRMTASLVTLAKESGLTRVDHVVLSRQNEFVKQGENVFVVQGKLDDPAHDRAHMKTELAAHMPEAESHQRLQTVNERLAQQHALEQQHNIHTQQQDAQRSPVMSR